MTMGVPWDSARASCWVSSSIFSTTPVLCSNLIDRILQLLIEHAPVGHDDDGVKHLLIVLVMQAGQAGAQAKQSSSTCRNQTNAGLGNSDPLHWPWCMQRPVSELHQAGDNVGRSLSLSTRCARPFRSLTCLLLHFEMHETLQDFQAGYRPVAPRPTGSGSSSCPRPAALPAPWLLPRLNGRKLVSFPLSLVVIHTSSGSTAKWTKRALLESEEKISPVPLLACTDVSHRQRVGRSANS